MMHGNTKLKSKESVALITVEAKTSNVIDLLIHAFGIPTASPVLSLDRICKILEEHTHTHTHTL